MLVIVGSSFFYIIKNIFYTIDNKLIFFRIIYFFSLTKYYLYKIINHLEQENGRVADGDA